MIEKLALIALASTCLVGCAKINQSMQALECNRQAIDNSTQVICENIQAIQQANMSIAENKRQLDAINITLKQASEQ